MFTVLNEAIQADMEHLQTGTQTVPCAVTQALMKMDAGLTANLGKIRNTACCMLAMQKEYNKAPPAFGLGTQTCITSRRQFQINKSWVYQGDQAHSSMAASKKKKKTPKESWTCVSGQFRSCAPRETPGLQVGKSSRGSALSGES